MVGKGVETRARTTEIIGPRSNPSVFSSNVDQLVIIESGEWNVSRFALSLLLLFPRAGHIPLFEELFRGLGILECSFCIGTER